MQRSIGLIRIITGAINNLRLSAINKILRLSALRVAPNLKRDLVPF